MTSEQQNLDSRIESRQEVGTYLARLKYALESDSAKIVYQEKRRIDTRRQEKYSNEYTLEDLFPGQEAITILKEELLKLNNEEYIETVKDTRKQSRSEMRVFGRVYFKGEVYIKIRVELCNVKQCYGADLVFVMSYHYSTENFEESTFPYKRLGD